MIVDIFREDYPLCGYILPLPVVPKMVAGQPFRGKGGTERSQKEDYILRSSDFFHRARPSSLFLSRYFIP